MTSPLTLFGEFARTARLGIDNVRAHKLRSILTVLGIVFGVCSVISMLSIGEGAKVSALEQLNALGSNNIILKSFKPPQNPDESGGGSNQNMMLEYGITYRDAQRLADMLPDVEIVVPIKTQPMDLWVNNRKLTVQLLATVPWMEGNQSIRVIAGSFISPLDLERKANVAVLGDKVARALFRYEDPIGKPVRIGSDVYRVIGIVASAGPTGAAPSGVQLASQSAECFIPITTLRARQGDMFIRRTQGSMMAEKVELSELILKVKSQDDVLPVSQLVKGIMDDTHPKGDYELIVPLALLEATRKTQQTFSIVLSSIAAISLLVGGIGIMNIMLASVSERTREIGVRRALGARRRDIMQQFLVETLILSLGGGLLGMALGAAIPYAVTYYSEMKTVLTPFAFFLSFFVSAVIGLIFGLYPARRAALMDPIEALRHE